jgi:hypothetical protein
MVSVKQILFETARVCKRDSVVIKRDRKYYSRVDREAKVKLARNKTAVNQGRRLRYLS